MTTDTPSVSAPSRMPGAWTWSWIGLLITVYLVQLLHAKTWGSPDIEALSQAGNIGYLTLTSEPWRLLTSMVMHGDWLHLLMNLAVLAYVGPLVEAVWGGPRAALVFLAGGLIAGLGSAIGGVAMAEQVNILGQVRYDLIVSVGASGALMAWCGALFAAHMLDEGEHRHPLLQEKGVISGLLPTVGLTLAFGFIRPSSDQVAHIVGLVSGALLGACLLQTMRAPKRLTRALGPVVCMLLATAPVAMLMPDPAALELKAVAEEIAEREKLETMQGAMSPAGAEEQAQPLLPDPQTAPGVGTMWSSKADEL